MPGVRILEMTRSAIETSHPPALAAAVQGCDTCASEDCCNTQAAACVPARSLCQLLHGPPFLTKASLISSFSVSFCDAGSFDAHRERNVDEQGMLRDPESSVASVGLADLPADASTTMRLAGQTLSSATALPQQKELGSRACWKSLHKAS